MGHDGRRSNLTGVCARKEFPPLESKCLCHVHASAGIKSVVAVPSPMVAQSLIAAQFVEHAKKKRPVSNGTSFRLRPHVLVPV